MSGEEKKSDESESKRNEAKTHRLNFVVCWEHYDQNIEKRRKPKDKVNAIKSELKKIENNFQDESDFQKKIVTIFTEKYKVRDRKRDEENKFPRERTILHMLIKSAFEKRSSFIIIYEFLKKKLTLDQRKEIMQQGDEHGNTIFHYFGQHGYVAERKILEYLLKNDPEVINHLVKKKNKYNETAFYHAYCKSHDAMLLMLLGINEEFANEPEQKEDNTIELKRKNGELREITDEEPHFQGRAGTLITGRNYYIALGTNARNAGIKALSNKQRMLSFSLEVVSAASAITSELAFDPDNEINYFFKAISLILIVIDMTSNLQNTKNFFKEYRDAKEAVSSTYRDITSSYHQRVILIISSGALVMQSLGLFLFEEETSLLVSAVTPLITSLIFGLFEDYYLGARNFYRQVADDHPLSLRIFKHKMSLEQEQKNGDTSSVLPSNNS